MKHKDILLSFAASINKPFHYGDIRELEHLYKYNLNFDRRVRELCVEGKLRRIPDFEARERGLVKDGKVIAYFEMVSVFKIEGKQVCFV